MPFFFNMLLCLFNFCFIFLYVCLPSTLIFNVYFYFILYIMHILDLDFASYKNITPFKSTHLNFRFGGGVNVFQWPLTWVRLVKPSNSCLIVYLSLCLPMWHGPDLCFSYLASLILPFKGKSLRKREIFFRPDKKLIFCMKWLELPYMTSL